MNKQSTTGKSKTPKSSKTSKKSGKRKTTRETAVPAVAGRKDMTRSASSASKKPKRGPDPQARHEMIAEAAYFRAERRGFAAGGEFDDWLEAERDMARTLKE